jgi:peptidoglycan/LPS O-acetylase OafA/YrhL
VLNIEKETRIHSLDSIRGIAAIIVVFFHSIVSFPTIYDAQNLNTHGSWLLKLFTYTPLHLLWAGHEAVLLFFVLSGFVLSLPFIRGNAPNYKNYAIKRFCRIYIPYIIIMLIYMVVITALGDYEPIASLSKQFNGRWAKPITLSDVNSTVFMLGLNIGNINGVVWSLIHELRISLIFPIIIWMVIKLDSKLALGLGLTGCTLLRLVLFYIGKKISNPELSFTVLYFSSTAYYIAFFYFGAVLAKEVNKAKSFVQRLKPFEKFTLLIASFTIISFDWIFPHFDKLIAKKGIVYNLVFDAVGEWIIALGIVMLFAIVLGSPLANNILTTRPLVWLGKVSYSVYLVHVMVIMLSARYLSQLIPMKAALLLCPILTLPLAALAYRYIEAPAMRLGKRLTSGSKGR